MVFIHKYRTGLSILVWLLGLLGIFTAFRMEGVKTFDHRKFLSDYMDAKEEMIISEDPEFHGIFMYGPYINLSRGKYQLVVHYESDTDLRYELTRNMGTKILKEGILKAGTVRRELSLSVPDDINDRSAEFRVRYDGSGTFRFRSLDVRRTGWIKDAILMMLVMSLAAFCLILVYGRLNPLCILYAAGFFCIFGIHLRHNYPLALVLALLPAVLVFFMTGKDVTNQVGRAYRLPLAAFLISAAVMVVLYIIKGIAPFGPQCVLNMDLWCQYMPMYIQQADISSLPELLFSWNGGLGYNNWAQAAYYTNSPFLLLLRFVSPGHAILTLDLICLLKVAFSSAACCIYLQKTVRTPASVLAASSVCYSICAYALAFLTQPMWSDALILAPLILLGIDRLIRQKRGGFYALMLALCIAVNFYIGYTVCIFSALYFLFRSPCLLAGRGGEKKIRVWLKTAGSFALYSLLAGAISAIVLIPAVTAIGNTIASELGAPEKLSFYGSIKDYLEYLLPAQSLKHAFTGVNIFTGILVFPALPLYVLNRHYRRKEKLLDGIFLAVLFLSMNCNILDYVWHGFHFPNQLPGRWTFLFSLYVTVLVCKGFSYLDKLSLRSACLGSIAGLALWLFASYGNEDIRTNPWYLVLLLAACAAVIIPAAASAGKKKVSAAAKFQDNAAHKTQVNAAGRLRKSTAGIPGVVLACFLLATIQIAGSTMNFLQVAEREPGGLDTSKETGYSGSIVRMRKLGELLKSGEDEFYRVETNRGLTFNPSMFSGYRGIGYYSSTMNGNLYRFLGALGNKIYAKNVSTIYCLASPVQNGLFGVRYIVDLTGNLPSVTAGKLKLAEKGEEWTIYENETSLPIAYMVSEEAEDFTIKDPARGIENQEAFLSALCGENQNVFSRMTTESFGYENCTLSESPLWEDTHYLTEDPEKPVQFHYTYRCEQGGDILLENNFRSGDFKIRIGKEERTLPATEGKILFLGNFPENTEVKIDFSAEKISIGCCGLNLYRCSEENWRKAYGQLSRSGLQVDHFVETDIRGKIEASEGGLVMCSIVQDGGWQVYVDQKKAETIVIADTLLAFRIPAGLHEVRLVYHVPGMRAGTVISVFALIILVILVFRKNHRIPG